MRYFKDRRLAIGPLGFFRFSHGILVTVTQVSHGINGYKIHSRPAQEDAAK